MAILSQAGDWPCLLEFRRTFDAGRFVQLFEVQAGFMDKSSYVYILAGDRYGTLYVGVTSELARRIFVHREGLMDGFSKEHSLHRLVWFETHMEIMSAITREKQIKHWKRAWKVKMISEFNPTWRDLYDELGQS